MRQFAIFSERFFWVKNFMQWRYIFSALDFFIFSGERSRNNRGIWRRSGLSGQLSGDENLAHHLFPLLNSSFFGQRPPVPFLLVKFCCSLLRGLADFRPAFIQVAGRKSIFFILQSRICYFRIPPGPPDNRPYNRYFPVPCRPFPHGLRLNSGCRLFLIRWRVDYCYRSNEGFR